MGIKAIAGANWRTTVSGIGASIMGFLTILAALPYEMGAVADIFPATWKTRIAVAGAVATLILRTIQSTQTKDKAVTGGTKPNDPPSQ